MSARTGVDDNDYQPPFRFTGNLDKLTIKLAPLNAAEEESLQQRIQDMILIYLSGDPRCLKLCLERILPPLKEPAEPKQIQHAIEVVLRQPAWLELPEPAPTMSL